jgi:hypothetical protein
LISVATPADEAPDPLVAQAEQTPAGDAPGAGIDATASGQTAAAEHASAAPVDYSRVKENEATSVETVGPGRESVADKEDDKFPAAESDDKLTAEGDDSASAVDAEPQAASAESATDSAKKT